LINEEIIDLNYKLAYIQLISSLAPGIDFPSTIKLVSELTNFFRNADPAAINLKIGPIKKSVNSLFEQSVTRYPLKKKLKEVVLAYNNLYEENPQLFDTGITYGFLNTNIDLSKFKWYADMPFHYVIGLGHHKGNSGIEEDMLLKDSFAALLKAENNFDALTNASLNYKTSVPNKEEFKQLTDIKYEVAFYSRMTIISFFSFLECFINSIGFSYMYCNLETLSEEDKLGLKGLYRSSGKKQAYMNLRNKIEKLQTIIRKDKTVVLTLSDDNQLSTKFKLFFNEFESLRNAAVHYSPLKTRIWLGSDTWIAKARDFSDIALDLGLQVWKACYPNSDGPLYLGKLDKTIHTSIARKRFATLDKLQ
jgi:hypothetical protein